MANRVKVYERGSKLYLRFTYAGKQYKQALGLSNNTVGTAKALALALEIETSLVNGTFEPDKLPTYNQKTQELQAFLIVEDSKNSLKKVWEYYLKNGNLQDSTRKGYESAISTVINSISDCTIDEFIDFITKEYANSSCQRICAVLRTAFNFASLHGYYEGNNPFSLALKKIKSKSPKKSKTIECFAQYEVKSIILAFETGMYASLKKRATIKHYAPFVKALFLLGARPQDIIAMTVSSIKDDCIVIDKAFTNGILKSTKNGKSRQFPISNDDLRELLESQADGKKHDALLFPSHNSGYINLNKFTSLYWKPTIESLINEGIVSKYLPTYHTRHTFITQCLLAGIDVMTVAEWVENSPKVIYEHYAGFLPSDAKPVNLLCIEK